MGVKKRHITYVPKSPQYFENFSSDEESARKVYKQDRPMLKTSVVACTFKDGLVMGTVAKTVKEEIFKLKNGSLCSGFGTTAWNERYAVEIEAERDILFANIRPNTKVFGPNRLLQKIQHKYSQPLILSSLIVGGIFSDEIVTRPIIYRINSRRAVECDGFIATGIRFFAPMNVFEAKWNENLDEIGATQLVKEALESVQFSKNSLVEIEVINMKTPA